MYRDRSEFVLAGNLTADPELEFIQRDNEPLARLKVRIGVYGGQDRESAFYDITVWGDLAEHVAASARKGDRIVAVVHQNLVWAEGRDGVSRQYVNNTASEVGLSLRWHSATSHRHVAKQVDETTQPQLEDVSF